MTSRLEHRPAAREGDCDCLIARNGGDVLKQQQQWRSPRDEVVITENDMALVPSSLKGQRSGSKSCVITISALNNFGFVWSLYDSVVLNSPSIDCFVWFVGDASEGSLNSEFGDGMKSIRKIIEEKPLNKFTLVTMAEMEESLGDFDANKVAFMFDLVALQTTIKPFAFRYAFKELDVVSAIYLDNDIWVTSSLEFVQSQLERRSVVVTPHIASPIPEDGKRQRDKNILASGVFNFGFVGVSNTGASLKFLEWWGARLVLYGYSDQARAMFYDQNWGMFIPVLFDHEDYYVIRDLRYNIAYWNLHETGPGLHMKDGLPHMTNPITKKDEKVVFMHFSGMSLLEAYDMEHISRHQNRFTLKDFPRIENVFLAYMQFVAQHDTLRYRSIPYGFANFTDGTQIQDCMRRAYAAAVYPIGPETTNYLENEIDPPYDLSISPFMRATFHDQVHNDPFCATKECLTNDNSSKTSFLNWLLTVTPSMAVNMEGKFYFSFLQEMVWKVRTDLQKAFPDPTGADYDQYLNWFQNHAIDSTITPQLLAKWKSTLMYHKNHHSDFHKHVTNENDIGVNVIGWPAGQFKAGRNAATIIRATNKANLPVNAVQGSMHWTAEELHYSLPADLDFQLTRSCSQPVNLIVINPDITWYINDQIPQMILKHKYNIGFWVPDNDDTIPKEWMQFLNIYDEIWCPSSSLKTSIETASGYDGTVVKVLDIPLDFEKDNDSINAVADLVAIGEKIKMFLLQSLKAIIKKQKANGN
eukprot:CAMPEP_0172521998 /NCGR_PEP_ID=MMETSP1066-20121228/292886_1 /TAXON_ID=671091 /ORGANISM="Coscinodiscus wailesii, Strain CCMP2513" /LENGTH=753 /DNA_ID=CAMNT_0013304963 /DNA_START=140 /DNA_END=2401 /DNA_ORIENTATION=-